MSNLSRDELNDFVGKRVKISYDGPDDPTGKIGVNELIGKITSLGIAMFCFDPDDVNLRDTTLTISSIVDISIVDWVFKASVLLAFFFLF